MPAERRAGARKRTGPTEEAPVVYHLPVVGRVTVSAREAAQIRDWLWAWVNGVAYQPDQTLGGLALSGFVLGVNAAKAHPALTELMIEAIYVLDQSPAHRDDVLAAIFRAEQALAELSEILRK